MEKQQKKANCCYVGGTLHQQRELLDYSRCAATGTTAVVTAVYLVPGSSEYQVRTASTVTDHGILRKSGLLACCVFCVSYPYDGIRVALSFTALPCSICAIDTSVHNMLDKRFLLVMSCTVRVLLQYTTKENYYILRSSKDIPLHTEM